MRTFENNQCIIGGGDFVYKTVEAGYVITDILKVSKSRMEEGIYERINSVPMGRHSDCFVYVAEGSCKYRFTNGYENTAKKGDIVYLAKGSRYVMKVFEEGYIPIFEHHSEKSESAVFSLSSSEDLYRMFRKLYETWMYKPDLRRIFCMSILYEIYCRIVTQINQSYIPKSKISRLDIARNIILDNYSKSSLSVSYLANYIDMSEGHFRRLFKKVYGVTPVEYIKITRISHAKDLLLCSDLSVAEISEKVGYNDVGYFSRAFKSIEVCSPKSYRTNYKDMI